MGTESIDYCREIESYLCQKNDGHLIRVVGPSFELVSRWAAQGVPLKVAFHGIDRYFERYYRKGPRRRPVRIDFCEADVLELFDDWRRAVGLTAGDAPDPAPPHAAERRGPSLPSHVARVVARLTNARATGALGAEADGLIDRVSQELDAARASSQGLRGDARRALIERLAQLDGEVLQIARSSLNGAEGEAISREAEQQLEGFRGTMPEAAYRRAREAAIDRIVRERFGLPTLSFT